MKGDTSGEEETGVAVKSRKDPSDRKD